ncbi:Chaperone protein dnaJ 49 [Dendrobium catenatum]|uniref:Chaperone protein dnaJ 49 n=1 Tax=Dendrobium catenatum TaxID=906689 RepID=A0A2I0W9Y1_9ASPA|nr:Chaperone protein dnaJ 49 [Dendrobium catenatum]
MDTNLIEAKKALEKAEAKFKSGDALGAIQLALKAKRLFPNLHGLAAHLESYRIHSAFDPKFPNRTDWYAILNVKRSLGLETIRKRFKELRALTHPDKNSSSAAEGAFKLVYRAWETIYKELGNSSNGNNNDEEEEEEEPTSSAAPEKTKCPDCGRQCVYIDSLGTVFECKHCKLIAMRSGREEILMVIRDGFARIDVNGELNTNINVHGGDTTVNGVKGVHIYGGESILITRCKGVELKGGNSIHMSNCTQININGSGNISYE